MKHFLLDKSRYAVVAASLAALGGCCCEQNTEWRGSCFEVTDPAADPSPHAKVDYKFCISKLGNKWWFLPGYRMGHWEALTGGGEIPMTLQAKDEDSYTWTVEANITNHPTGGNHGSEHSGNDWSFTVEVSDYADPDLTEASITGAGGPTGGTHGGAAHASID